MPSGTVRWFNQKIGAGFIRTDDGENVLFLHSALKQADSSLLCKGSRVYLDILRSQYGLRAVNVRDIELAEHKN